MTQGHTLLRHHDLNPASPHHGGPGSAVRSIYLPTVSDAAYASVHVPAGLVRGGPGVIICPPFGWDEECTFRARRVWAQTLADAGYPVIRLQLPGTGDSLGSLAAPDRLASWTSAVSAAGEWLREELSVARVCGLGIGFG